MSKTLFDTLVDDIVDQGLELAKQIETLPEEQRIRALNRVRTALHRVSPFKDEPIDLVLWEKGERVKPNDYNPNVVHRPEMRLLEESIDVDHMTQPVVTSSPDADPHVDPKPIVDGEHRYIICTDVGRIHARLRGYVPITIVPADTEQAQMASTVRHNRARGVHKLDGMTDIVLSMLQAGWEDDEIANAMGMDADEILRLKQVAGAAEAFRRPMYKRAWVFDDGQTEIETP
jgi:ParB-like chromosome segregation protein Spo0J